MKVDGQRDTPAALDYITSLGTHCKGGLLALGACLDM